MGPAAAGDGEAAEGHGHGGAGAHALLEEALAPVLALDPLRAGGGCDHQEGRDHAAREGDHLQTNDDGGIHTHIEITYNSLRESVRADKITLFFINVRIASRFKISTGKF